MSTPGAARWHLVSQSSIVFPSASASAAALPIGHSRSTIKLRACSGQASSGCDTRILAPGPGGWQWTRGPTRHARKRRPGGP